MAEEFETVACTTCGKILNQETFNLHDVYDHNGESFDIEPVQYCAVCNAPFLGSSWYCPVCFDDDKYFEVEHLDWFSQRVCIFGQQQIGDEFENYDLENFIESWLSKFDAHDRGVLAMLFYSRLALSNEKVRKTENVDSDLTWIRLASFLPKDSTEINKLKIVRDWLDQFRTWVTDNCHPEPGHERPNEFDLQICDEVWGLESGLQLSLQQLLESTGKSPAQIRYTLELTPAFTLGLLEGPKFTGLNTLNISRDYRLSTADMNTSE